jgi:HPt (histidine-containing phosphotransfer) domain-containing protein
MSDSGSDRANARLQALHDRFAASLRERLERLDVLVHAAREGSVGALDEAIVDAHRLAGTAGSFGYDGAGEAAAVLEGALRSIADGTADARVWDEALAALARARVAPPRG